MNWSDCSEIVVGLILDKRLSVNSVRPELFIEPYNRVIKLLQKEPETTIEDLIMKTGLQPIQGAFEQVHRMNGLGEKDWVKILEQSATLYDAGTKMGKMAQKMLQGDDIDWSQITGFAKRAQESLSKDLIPLSQIKSGAIPFIKTGWQALDDHTGGIPEVGLIVVGGRPKKGKTWFMTRLATSFIQEHTDKNVAVFSFEMMFPEIAARLRKTRNVGIENEERLYVCEQPHTAEEVLNICATIPNLGLVAIDFVDLMIVGTTDESSMSQIYRTLMLGAKVLHCPIVLLSQLNRASRDIPRPQDLRYTGLAEAFAWMILMIHEPEMEWIRKEKDAVEDQTLPIMEGSGYIIVWGSRGGFPMHPNDSPGAILIPFDGSRGGWSSHKSKWFSLRNVS